MKSKLLIFFVIISISISAQSSLDQIYKAYPSWTTNFEKTSIDLDELISGGPPKDGIPAILNPNFTTIDEASNWLAEKEPVMAVSQNGMSKAYPLQILMFHEIVNDRVGRTPIAVTFCPLCYSGIVFDRTINGMAVNFGVSGLLRNSDMVMYDQLTESFWQQFTGEAIVGDLTGSKLKVVPSQIISFKQFRSDYPDGLVLSKNTGFSRSYGLNPYLNYDNANTKPFLFKGDIDSRLPQNEKVIGIKMGEEGKAYPYSITSSKYVIHDVVDSRDIVIFHLPGTLSSMDKRNIEDSRDVGSTGVFSPFIDDTKLTFKYQDGKLVDGQTGSIWTVTGKCIEGEYESKSLKQIPHGDYFSFAWFVFSPNSELFEDK